MPTIGRSIATARLVLMLKKQNPRGSTRVRPIEVVGNRVGKDEGVGKDEDEDEGVGEGVGKGEGEGEGNAILLVGKDENQINEITQKIQEIQDDKVIIDYKYQRGTVKEEVKEETGVIVLIQQFLLGIIFGIMLLLFLFFRSPSQDPVTPAHVALAPAPVAVAPSYVALAPVAPAQDAPAPVSPAQDASAPVAPALQGSLFDVSKETEVVNKLQESLDTILTKFQTKEYRGLATPIKTLLDNWEGSTDIIAERFAPRQTKEFTEALNALITVDQETRESVTDIDRIAPGLADQLARIHTVPFDSIARDKDFQGLLTSSGLSSIATIARNTPGWLLSGVINKAVGAKVQLTDDTNLWAFMVKNNSAVAKVMSSKGIESISGGKNTRKNKRSRVGNRQKYGRKNRGRSLRKNKRSSRKKKSKQNKYLLRKNLKHSKKKKLINSKRGW